MNFKGVASQNTELFMAIAVETSDSTNGLIICVPYLYR
jgi:hypothetical protein